MLKTKLSRTISFFFVAQIIARAGTFLVVPLQVERLGLADFGILETIFITVSILLPILTLNLHEAVFKFNLKCDKYLLILLPNIILIPILIVFILTIYLTSYSTEIKELAIYVCFYGFFFCLWESLKRYLKAKSSIKNLIYSEFVNSFFLIIGSFALYYSNNLTLQSTLVVYIASCFLALCFIIKVQSFNSLALKLSSKNYHSDFINSIKFSSPLLPNSLLWWLTNYIDRLIIIFSMGMEATGIYSLIVKSVSVYKVIGSSIYDGIKVSLFSEKDVKSKFVSYGYNYALYSLLVFFISIPIIFFLLYYFGVSLSTNVLLTSFTLLVSVMFLSFSSYLGLIYISSEQTKDAFKNTIYSFISNAIIGITLVHYFDMGILGVVVASLISSILLLTLRLRYAILKKYI